MRHRHSSSSGGDALGGVTDGEGGGGGTSWFSGPRAWVAWGGWRCGKAGGGGGPPSASVTAHASNAMFLSIPTAHRCTQMQRAGCHRRRKRPSTKNRGQTKVTGQHQQLATYAQTRSSLRPPRVRTHQMAAVDGEEVVLLSEGLRRRTLEELVAHPGGDTKSARRTGMELVRGPVHERTSGPCYKIGTETAIDTKANSVGL